MASYSQSLKESVVARMFPPENRSIASLSEETGIPRDTLYGWRTLARCQMGKAPRILALGNSLSSEEKFAIVVETAGMNELNLGEYCRSKGLYPEQILQWKNAFIQGVNPVASRVEREELLRQAKTIKQLQGELHRKEKALAEAAALLVLEKKVQALWGEPEEEKSTSWSAKK